MQCFKCGAQLGAEDTCPRCGANVKMYKKLIAISNYFYNIGLERARVRNLSGATDALKLSLQYYKANINARNLLGLIYHEIGETVSALSEWVISKSCQEKDNIADVYLADVQNNLSFLNTVNQTIKKYNQALVYCQQDSADLAIIQLKKIISTNPKLVKAHQLLALLYIRGQKYDLAARSLRVAERIDHNNTITLRYLAEIEEHTGTKVPKDKKRKKKENTVEYSNGTDKIIQPANVRDNSGWMMILNILVGLVIGVTATYFLIVPTIRQSLQKDAVTQIAEKNDAITSKNGEIQSLQDKLVKTEKEVETAQSESAASKTQADTYDKLLSAYQLFHESKFDEAESALTGIDQTKLDASAKQVYDTITASIDEEYLKTTYEEGYSEYMGQHFDVAAQMLQKVVDIDEKYRDGEAMYYLAQAYRILQEYEKAAELYQKVVDEYPSSFQHAPGYLAQVQAQLGNTAAPQQ